MHDPTTRPPHRRSAGRCLIPALLAAACLAPCPRPAAAWGALGHRLVCDIAFRELAPPIRVEVERLLATSREHRTFADACVWADRVRDEARFEWSKPYHYVNLPRRAGAVDPARDCQPQGCVLAGIYRYAGLLADPSASDRSRLMALRFVGHFVGDVHQPLHVSFAADLGGNRVRVRFPGGETNLHRLWDVDLVERGGERWRRRGRQLHAQITAAERRSWVGSGPLAWANESHAIALAPSTRYRDAPTERTLMLDEAYLEHNAAVVGERIERAGIRLAHLLAGALER